MSRVTEPGGRNAPVGEPAGTRRGHAGSRRDPGGAGSAGPSPAGPPPQRTDPGPADGVKRVRPYVRTGGRTRSRTELALETLVTVSGQPGSPPNLEYRNMVALCDVPRSIAEVAALSALPVGVARVLIGDLAEQGLLTVHDTRQLTCPAEDMALMQRVLAGLRRL
jgi:hypothetical protein